MLKCSVCNSCQVKLKKSGLKLIVTASVSICEQCFKEKLENNYTSTATVNTGGEVYISGGTATGGTRTFFNKSN